MHAKYVNERPALGINGGWNPPLRITGGDPDEVWEGESELVRTYTTFLDAHPVLKTSIFSIMTMRAFYGRDGEPVKIVVCFCLVEPFHVDTQGTMQWRDDYAKEISCWDPLDGGYMEGTHSGTLLATCAESLAGLPHLMERKLAKFKEDCLTYFKGVLEKSKGSADLEANYAYMKDIVEELEVL